MTGIQAASLRPGARIRRKRPSDDTAVYVVERVERVLHPTNDRKHDVAVHAGGRAFKAWEIERADPRQGRPKERDLPR